MTDYVLGATPEDQINKGETIDLELELADELGTPLNLSSATIAISEASHTVLTANATVTITNAATGKARLYLAAEHNTLPLGRLSWFRLRTVFGPESIDVTPQIWIEVS